VRKPALFGGRDTETPVTESMPIKSEKPLSVDPKMASETHSLEEPKASTLGERRAAIRYLDRADMAETFADSVTGLTFDGQTLRIEFGVTRLDNVQANAPISGRRYPACRLVLPPSAAVDLINRMQQIATALRRAGVVKPTQQTAQAPRGVDER
jgi:hypothetical protein